MSPTVKRTVALSVVGMLAVAALVSFVVQWNSTENAAATFGSLAFLSGLVFTALGWTGKAAPRE